MGRGAQAFLLSTTLALLAERHPSFRHVLQMLGSRELGCPILVASFATRVGILLNVGTQKTRENPFIGVIEE